MSAFCHMVRLLSDEAPHSFHNLPPTNLLPSHPLWVLPQFITQPSFACFWRHLETWINSSLKQLLSLNFYLYRAKCKKCPGEVSIISIKSKILSSNQWQDINIPGIFLLILVFLLLDHISAITEGSNNFKANYVNWKQVLCAWYVQSWWKVFIHLQRTCISWQSWVPIITTSLLFLWRNKWNTYYPIMKFGSVIHLL